MNRMEALVAQRTESRHRTAAERAADIQESARACGIEITLVGSLARNDFQLHSDIDLLVRGAINTTKRILVERLVADHLRDVGIAYDLIFEADMTEERVKELLNDRV